MGAVMKDALASYAGKLHLQYDFNVSFGRVRTLVRGP